jgi:hypothetical protein
VPVLPVPPVVVVPPPVVVPPEVVPPVVVPPDVVVLPEGVDDDGFVVAVELMPVPAFPSPPQPVNVRLNSSIDTVQACVGVRETNSLPRFMRLSFCAGVARQKNLAEDCSQAGSRE